MREFLSSFLFVIDRCIRLKLLHSSLLLIEHFRSKIDLAGLQFLRRAIGNFSIHPQSESFDLILPLGKCEQLSYASRGTLTPDRVIAGKGNDERSIRIPRTDGTA